jgi:predicted nucleotide-binding protein
MARISSELLQRLSKKLNLKPRRVYELIEAKVRETSLPRNLAAIALASDVGINISPFASEDDLAKMRGLAPRLEQAPVPSRGSARPQKRTRGQGEKPANPHVVFVVHGRDVDIVKELFAFLRSIGLKPLEWVQAIRKTGQGTPYVGAIVEAAFREAQAIVVLLTPDDEARLRKRFVRASDADYESELTGQPRPNVLFEAGMAFGRDSRRTVLVQVGRIREISDLAGRHIVHLTDHVARRNELATKLRNAGCAVDLTGEDWYAAGSFDTVT